MFPIVGNNDGNAAMHSTKYAISPRRFKAGKELLKKAFVESTRTYCRDRARVIGAPEVESAIQKPEAACHNVAARNLSAQVKSLLPTPMSDGLGVMRRFACPEEG